jgi:hypothetical protein
VTRTDGEIVTQNTQDEGAAAWFELFATVGQIGTSVGQLAEQGARREKRHHIRDIHYPATNSAIVNAAGNCVIDLGAPAQGRQWAVRRLLVVDATNPTGIPSGGTPTANSGTFAAAAGGSILLPAGASMTGFDVTVAPVTSGVSGLVTATNLAAGNLNWELDETTNGASLNIRFPSPLAASGAAATPQINVPAITGGATYAVTVYGTTAVSGTTPGVGWWYVGAPGAYGPQQGKELITSLPYIGKSSTEQTLVVPRDRLFVALTGATPGHQIIAHADVMDAEQGRAHIAEII